MIILFLLYSIVLELLYFLLSPILFLVFRYKPFSERLAINYPHKHFDIIVHAASVGEINGIKQFLIELINKHNDLRILLTTNTKTGRDAAQSIHRQIDVMLSPIDVFHLRNKQLSISNPSLILVAETEIWPNLLLCARIKKVPVIFINARISEKTFVQYKQFRSAFKWFGKSVRVICSQSKDDSDRFCQLFETECLRLGNLKFNVKLPEFDKNQIRSEWGYEPKDKIVVIGSSRPGEEKLLLSSYETLKNEFSNLKLVIVPRHLNRMSEIMNLLRGHQVSKYSDSQKIHDIHVIDEMGCLLKTYAICDIAIVGGSFYPFGGHNPLEAAFYNKPIIMGKYYSSCLDSVSKLKESNAIVISSAESLTRDLRKVLNDPELFSEYGLRAKKVLEDNKDSLNKHLEIVETILVNYA